jgi:dihydrofolate reductase
VHTFINDLSRPLGTHLYGRRMYDVMTYWETASLDGERGDPEHDFAEIWRAADKIVYSRTLASPVTAKTRVESSFDPVAVRQLKDAASSDLSIGGAELAAQALAAGLVDECEVFLNPIAVGGGKPVFPIGLRVRLELLDDRRFGNGTTYLRYAVHQDR